MKVLEDMITRIRDAVQLVCDQGIMPGGTTDAIQTLRDSQDARSKLGGPTHEHLIADMFGAQALMAVAQDAEIRNDIDGELARLEARINELEHGAL